MERREEEDAFFIQTHFPPPQSKKKWWWSLSSSTHFSTTLTTLVSFQCFWYTFLKPHSQFLHTKSWMSTFLKNSDENQCKFTIKIKLFFAAVEYQVVKLCVCVFPNIWIKLPRMLVIENIVSIVGNGWLFHACV